MKKIVIRTKKSENENGGSGNIIESTARLERHT